VNYKGRHQAALWSAYLEVNAHAGLSIVLLGWASGFFYYLFAVGPMLFLSPRQPLGLKITLSIASVMLLAVLLVFSHNNPPVYEVSIEVLTPLYIINMVCTFGLLAHLAHYYAQGADQSEAQLRKLSLKYEKLAISDSLTGLLNRRAATLELESEVNRCYRNHKPFVVVLGDIDDFKDYNDKYGHACGDEVLRQLASVLLKNTRPYDIISRWGGEEFLLIMPDCVLDDAMCSINELREKIATHLIECNSHKLNITMTFGVSEFNESTDMERCLEAADKALYSGKRLGKNRVEASILKDSGNYFLRQNSEKKGDGEIII
jgi:diguanylate cyclase (GGDEF)-like protein